MLAPDKYWEVIAPRYEGGRVASIRLRLEVNHEAEPIVSEPYFGAIHPEQFLFEEREAGDRSDPTGLRAAAAQGSLLSVPALEPLAGKHAFLRKGERFLQNGDPRAAVEAFALVARALSTHTGSGPDDDCDRDLLLEATEGLSRASAALREEPARDKNRAGD